MKARILATPLLLLAGASFATTLVAWAPASLLMALAPKSGVAYVRSEGTIWRGAVEGLVVEGAPLGRVSFRVHPFALFSGRLAAAIEIEGGAIEGEGEFAVGLGGAVTARAVAAEVDLSRFRRFGIMGATLSGAARIEADELAFSVRGCRAAAGSVWTDVLRKPAQRFGGEAFDLEGPARCDGPDLAVSLAGQGSDGAATLDIRLKPGFEYAFKASVAPQRAGVEEALLYFGFERADGALGYETIGSLRRASS